MRNRLWTSTEAAVVTGGKSSCTWHASGVSLNINDIHAGDLFLASPEDNISAAYARGAAVVAVPHHVEVTGDYPVLKVGSAFTALQGLSAAARFRPHAHVLSVQGRKARTDMAELLSVSYDVHTGGKHVSLGLANLPQNCDFGVFGLSPAVKPDIAVITNPETAYQDTLFENMGPSGAVIIYADSEGYLDVVARARAAGIKTILSYGRHASADAAIDECLISEDGIRLSGEVCGLTYQLVVPGNYQDNGMILAAMMVLHLTGRSVEHIVPKSNYLQSSEKKGIRLLDHKLKQTLGPKAILRIRNMIDLGRERQTAVLDDMVRRKTNGANDQATPENLQLPYQYDQIDLVHTGRKLSVVKNPYKVIKAHHKTAEITNVTSDVLAPGDILVFRKIWNSSQTILSEALRPIPRLVRKGIRT